MFKMKGVHEINNVKMTEKLLLKQKYNLKLYLNQKFYKRSLRILICNSEKLPDITVSGPFRILGSAGSPFIIQFN